MIILSHYSEKNVQMGKMVVGDQAQTNNRQIHVKDKHGVITARYQ